MQTIRWACLLQHSIATLCTNPLMPRISVKLLLTLHKLYFSSLPVVATTGLATTSSG